jgi:hypothetical protein
MKPQVAQLKGGKKMDSSDSSIQPTLFLDRFPSSGESSSHPKDFPLVSDQGVIHSSFMKVIYDTEKNQQTGFYQDAPTNQTHQPDDSNHSTTFFFKKTFRSVRTEGSIIYKNTGGAIPQIRSEILMHEAFTSGHPELRPPRIPLGVASVA